MTYPGLRTALWLKDLYLHFSLKNGSDIPKVFIVSISEEGGKLILICLNLGFASNFLQTRAYIFRLVPGKNAALGF